MGNQAEKKWYKLDNAAKIFPPTSSKSDTKVFRFACELYEEIDPVLLQEAVLTTLRDFPAFRCVLKRGMFWYYLEQSDIVPVVRQEDSPPCSTNYLEHKSLLFDVTWYGRRINFEAYHCLTDGTGALQFTKLLVLCYLKLAHPKELQNVSLDFDASDSQKSSDSFDKYYSRSKSKSITPVSAAYRIKGSRESEYRMNIIEGNVSVKEILTKAREYDTTATVLIIALLIRAIHSDRNVRDIEKPIVISVPVNLRNYFKSKSTRNFFGLVNIEYSFSDDESGELPKIIASVKKSLSESTNAQELQIRINKMFKWERRFFIRIVPLPIKNKVMGFVTYLAERGVTAAVSNVGKIEMPPQAVPFIKLFDVFSATKRVQMCICSFEDNMTISTTSPFVSKDIQHDFFKQLSDLGVNAEITANDLSKNHAEIDGAVNTDNTVDTVDTTGSSPIFPHIPLLKHKHVFLLKMLQLCSFAAVLAAVVINWILPQTGYWSLILIAGVACMWVSVIVAVKKRSNILKNITYQMNIACGLSVLWDYFTGWHGWSVDFIVPIAFASAMAAITIVNYVLKMQTGDYIIYSFVLGFYGIIPAILMRAGLVNMAIPSLICVAASLLSLATLLIFEGRNMAAELRRRLHL